MTEKVIPPPDKKDVQSTKKPSDDMKKDNDVVKNNKDKDKKKKKKEEPEDDMSEEDKTKKAEIDTSVEKLLTDVDVKGSLAFLTKELQTATSSMTSVPKPLKFLRSHFAALREKHPSMSSTAQETKDLSDIISVLGTTQIGDERFALQYRMSGNPTSLLSWGAEYLRNLIGEMISDFTEKQEANTSTQTLLDLTKEIVPHLMKTGSPIEAIDLLGEMGELSSIVQYVHVTKEDHHTTDRICRYLLSLAQLLPDAEPITLCKSVYSLYLKSESYVDALRVALKLDDEELCKEVLIAAKDDLVMQKQMALLLCRHRRFCHIFDEQDGTTSPLANDELRSIASGEKQAEHYNLLAKELDVLEPKLPEDIYKTHLEERRNVAAAALDSAKQNLASTIVNAFVNAGFSTDKLMTDVSSDEQGGGGGGTQQGGGAAWLYRNKDRGMMAAVASLGALHLWNPDQALGDVDKYTYSSDGTIKAGAWMAIGLASSGVRTDVDVAKGLLSEPLGSSDQMDRLGAVLGLGYAYAGSAREDLKELLTPSLLDTSFGVEVSAMAAVSLGLIYVGSEDADLIETLLQALMDQGSEDSALSSPAIFTAVALGLLFLCKGESPKLETTVELLDALETPLALYAKLSCKSSAFAASGNVLQVQQMLQLCAEHKDDEDDKNALVQSLAVLAVPLIAMGEEVGTEMIQRTMDHILQYGDVHRRRAVPVGIALQFISNPKPTIVDTLSKLSHDSDADVALHAVLALGLVGLGTNNSRVAGLLRQLAAFYGRDANALFIVRISQGLLYTGKGLLTASPLHSDWLLTNPVSLASLLVTLHAVLHTKNTLLGKLPYLLYHLVPALHPRMLVTLDENLEHLPASVRVGQALDVVGQAGKPKSITGFQTHNSPVLLSYTHRAELAAEEYVSVGSVLEGAVILKKNPDYKPTTES